MGGGGALDILVYSSLKNLLNKFKLSPRKHTLNKDFPWFHINCKKKIPFTHFIAHACVHQYIRVLSPLRQPSQEWWLASHKCHQIHLLRSWCIIQRGSQLITGACIILHVNSICNAGPVPQHWQFSSDTYYYYHTWWKATLFFYFESYEISYPNSLFFFYLL